MIHQTLTPTLDSIKTSARSPAEILEGYSDIQLALYSLLKGVDLEFCETLWAFQSYVFYNNQKEIPGISDLPLEEFIDHCRSRAHYFYNTHAENIHHIANKQIHSSMLPSFENGIDERPSFTDAVRNIFGFPENNTRHSDINLKATIIFSYFGVICETVLNSTTEKTLP
jgi:hypothetical protein